MENEWWMIGRYISWPRHHRPPLLTPPPLGQPPRPPLPNGTNRYTSRQTWKITVHCLLPLVACMQGGVIHVPLFMQARLFEVGRASCPAHMHRGGGLTAQLDCHPAHAGVGYQAGPSGLDSQPTDFFYIIYLFLLYFIKKGKKYKNTKIKKHKKDFFFMHTAKFQGFSHHIFRTKNIYFASFSLF